MVNSKGRPTPERQRYETQLVNYILGGRAPTVFTLSDVEALASGPVGIPQSPVVDSGPLSLPDNPIIDGGPL